MGFVKYAKPILIVGLLSNPYGSSASMVNAAIDGFVLGAAIELERGIRLNAVSPGVVQKSLDAFGFWCIF